jgi:glycosyltransferase involved in cell wall biosynthesis
MEKWIAKETTVIDPEIVVNQHTGWIIPSDDPSAMAAALTNAASDPQKRHTLGNNAKNRFLESFTFDTMIQQYKKIYIKFAEQRRTKLNEHESF